MRPLVMPWPSPLHGDDDPVGGGARRATGRRTRVARRAVEEGCRHVREEGRARSHTVRSRRVQGSKQFVARRTARSAPHATARHRAVPQKRASRVVAAGARPPQPAVTAIAVRGAKLCRSSMHGLAATAVEQPRPAEFEAAAQTQVSRGTVPTRGSLAGRDERARVHNRRWCTATARDGDIAPRRWRAAHGVVLLWPSCLRAR